MKIKIQNSIIAFAIILFSTVFLFSCNYDEILPIVIELPEGEVVSYSQDIQPIFEAKCNSNIGCHNGGSVPPNLQASDSYNELITGNYINTNTPKNSTLYTSIDAGGSMEIYVSKEQKAYILKWIEEGAENN